MSFAYVIPDIHGRYDLLGEAATTIIPRARYCMKAAPISTRSPGGRGGLTIGVFEEDRPGGPVDLIVVERPPAGR